MTRDWQLDNQLYSGLVLFLSQFFVQNMKAETPRNQVDNGC